MAVVATVGTTSTASVDPIPEIVKICRSEKIWLHIDGAYGGGFAIVPEHESLRKGWELPDSIVINPHKTVFVPLDFSVLYVRGLERLRRVFTLVPEYLRGDTVEAEKNYMDYGIQLGRRFRALKAWVIWRSLGREGIIGRLREQIRLANLFAEWVRQDSRFEMSAPVSMSVVCFRFVGDAAPSPRRGEAARGRAGSIQPTIASLDLRLLRARPSSRSSSDAFFSFLRIAHRIHVATSVVGLCGRGARPEVGKHFCVSTLRAGRAIEFCQ